MGTDPAVHAIEAFVLGFVTFGLVVYLLVFLACLWTDREYTVGRDEWGRARARRELRVLHHRDGEPVPRGTEGPAARHDTGGHDAP